MRLLLSLLLTALSLHAAEVTHYYDEPGRRFLMLTTNGNRVELRVRFAYDPGSMGVWDGNGEKRDGGMVFAATVPEEGMDRGPFFTGKLNDTKVVIDFRTEKPDQPDPGIRGEFRKISEEKRLQLAKKEFKAAEDRLDLAWKNASRDGNSADKAIVPEWKVWWPKLREMWLKVAAQPSDEKNTDHWQKAAQVTMLAYSFNEQRVDPKHSGGWEGEYDDGFGGHVSIRMVKDGKLRVTMTCTRGNEAQGTDLSFDVPAEAQKEKGGERTATAFARPAMAETPEAPKSHRLMLRRKGGGLCVAVIRQGNATSSAWLDGIYRWYPVPEAVE
ncbi:MAG: hypothetical protein RIS79_3953 [Verrucomicrobiota bacterium]